MSNAILFGLLIFPGGILAQAQVVEIHTYNPYVKIAPLTDPGRTIECQIDLHAVITLDNRPVTLESVKQLLTQGRTLTVKLVIGTNPNGIPLPPYHTKKINFHIDDHVVLQEQGKKMRSLIATILVFMAAVSTTVAQEPMPKKTEYSLRGWVYSVNSSAHEITVASNRDEKHYRLLVEPDAEIQKGENKITMEDMRKLIILGKRLKISAFLESEGKELPQPPYRSKKIGLYFNEDENEIEIRGRRRFLFCTIFSVDEQARKIVVTSPDPKDASKSPITTILTLEENTEIWEQEKPHEGLSLADLAAMVKERKSIEVTAVVVDKFQEGENDPVHLAINVMIRQKKDQSVPIGP